MKNLLCTICLMLALLVSGCSQFADNRVAVKPTAKIDTSSREFRAMLAIVIKALKTEDINWIRADLALAAYKAGLD